MKYSPHHKENTSRTYNHYWDTNILCESWVRDALHQNDPPCGHQHEKAKKENQPGIAKPLLLMCVSCPTTKRAK